MLAVMSDCLSTTKVLIESGASVNEQVQLMTNNDHTYSACII